MKKLSLVLLGACCFYTSIQAENLLRNADFQKLNKKFPAFWAFGKYSGAEAKAAIDNQIFHTSNTSVRIVKTNDKGWTQLVQSVNFKALSQPREVKVSAWIYSEKTKLGGLVVMADSTKRRNIIWKNLKHFSGTFGWKQIEGKAIIPAGTKRLSISVRLSRKGIIWVDDCIMEFTGKDEKLSGNLLKNPELKGRIQQLTQLPEGWRKKFVAGYENVSNIKVKSSVLEITWKSGGAKFGAEAFSTNILPPGNYIFSASCRTTGNSQAQLSVGNYNSKPKRSESWQNIHTVFKLKSGEKINPVCWNLGQGKVQYKNFSLTKTKLKVVDSFPIQTVVMPVSITKIWKGVNEFNTFTDTPVPLSFEFKGDKSKFKKAALVLELPVELSIAEAFNMHTGLTQVEKAQITPLERDGRKFNRYTFVNPRVFGIIRKNFAWERKLAMAIVPTKAQLAGKVFPVYWHLEADGRRSDEKKFNLRLLHPMKKTKMPKSFPNYSWRLLDMNFASPQLLKKVADGIEKSGMNYRKRSSAKRYRAIDNVLKKSGWKFYATTPDYYHPRFCGLNESALKNKIAMSQNPDGSNYKHRICPFYFNNNQEFKQHLYSFLLKKYKSYGTKNGDVIIFDVEPWEPMEWCFCKSCRNDFARKNNLKAVPSPLEIKSKYASQWSSFRNAQTAEATKLLAAFFRKNYPASKVFDYDYVVDFSKPGYRNYYKAVAKDPQLNEKYIDGHFASYYHYTDKRAFDLININIKNLKKDYYVVAALDKLGYLNSNEILSPQRMRMLLLAAAVNGAKGFSIYPGEHFDGLYLQMFNRTMPLVAELEKTFQKGKDIRSKVNITPEPYLIREIKIGNKIKKIARPNWKDYFVSRAYKLNNRIILSIFNYNPDRVMFSTASLKVSAGKYTIVNLQSGKRLIPKKNSNYWTQKTLSSFITKTNPMNTTFISIRAYRPSDESIPVITAASLQVEFERQKAETTDKEEFKTVSSGNLKIEIDDIDNNGEIEIVLSSKSQKVWIDPLLSGAVVRWKYKNVKLIGWNTGIAQKSRIICVDRFWLPKSWRGSVSEKYKLKQAVIVNNKAVLKLSKTLADKGLIISKTYKLASGSSGLEVEYSIKNIGKHPSTFSFWIHNYPIFGNSSSTPSTAIYLNSKSGNKKIFNKHFSRFYPFSSEENPGFSSKELSDTLTSGKVTVSNSQNNTGINIELSPKQVAGIYIWSSTNPTLEWIFKATTLTPGSSWKGNSSFTPFE